MYHALRQTRPAQFTVAVLAATMASITGVGVAGAAGVPATRESVVPSTTVAIIATPERVTVATEAPIRIGPAQAAAELDVFLDGSDDAVRAEIIAVIDDARADMRAAAATTAFLVADVGSGCFAAETVTVVRPGPSPLPRDVMVSATFPDDEDDVQCVVALHSIAIVAVDIADVPVGGADQADLVMFAQVDEGESVDLLARVRLAPPLRGHTQLAIEFMGCQARSAELVITSDAIRAIGNQGDDSHNPLCAAPEFFLGLFELPNWAIPRDAEIHGLVATYDPHLVGVLPADRVVPTGVLPGDDVPTSSTPQVSG